MLGGGPREPEGVGRGRGPHAVPMPWRQHAYIDPLTGRGRSGIGPSTMLGTGAMIGGFALYETMKMGLSYDQAINLGLLNLGIPDPGSPEGVAARRTIEQTIEQASRGTTFPQRQVAPALAQMYPMIATGVQGTPEERAKLIQGFAAEALRFAEIETQYVHKGTLESNLTAAVNVAHLSRTYDPELMRPMLSQMLAMTRLTEASPADIANILKYSMTTGGVAGIDPREAMSVTGFLLQSMRGTTAGTGPANLFYELLRGEAPSTEHGRQLNELMRRRTEFEHAIHGETGIGETVAGRRPRTRQQTEALVRLGLLDPRTHQLLPQFEDEQGHMREIPIIQQLARSAQERGTAGAADLALGLQQRGMRIMSPFMGEGAAVFQQYLELQKRLTDLVGVMQTQGVMAATPMGEVMQAGARFEDFLTKLVTAGEKGTSAIDRLGDAAARAAAILDSLTGWVSANPAGMTHAMDWMQRTGEGAFGGMVLGAPFGLAGPGALLGGAAGGASYLLQQYGEGVGQRWRERAFRQPVPLPSGQGSGITVPTIPQGSGAEQLFHKESYTPGGGGVQIHIQNISFAPGTPREHADQFAAELARRLSDAQLHDLGTGWGHHQSVYSSGRTLSI